MSSNQNQSGLRKMPLPQDAKATLETMHGFEKLGGKVVVDKTAMIINAEKDYDPVNMNLANLPKYDSHYQWLSERRDDIEYRKNTVVIPLMRKWLARCNTTTETVTITRHDIEKKITRDIPAKEQDTADQAMAAGFAWDAIDEYDKLEGLSFTLKQRIAKIRNHILPTVLDDEVLFGEGDGEGRDRRAAVRDEQLKQLKGLAAKMMEVGKENARLRKENEALTKKKGNGKKVTKNVNDMVVQPTRQPTTAGQPLAQ